MIEVRAADPALLLDRLDLDPRAARERTLSAALACVTGSLDEGEVHALSLADRHSLVRGAALAEGLGEVSAVANCPACEEDIELTLDLDAFEPPDVDEPIVIRLGEASRDCRLPRPADLEAASDPLDLVASCLGTSRDEAAPWQEVAEEALSNADPLGAILIAGACPGCGEPLEAGHDLVAAWLTGLRRSTDVLLREVHALATYYHWSEDAILRLPAPRRRAYIDLCRGMVLDEEEDFA
ncbi:hypothetical protein P12x_000791 [Tundrisphaera lichenicola]|uniref:hypothetical protein n=1 Tax=Tundrisphaera lichenicola TaxID=2029860 RepID=UPI003EB6975D